MTLKDRIAKLEAQAGACELPDIAFVDGEIHYIFQNATIILPHNGRDDISRLHAFPWSTYPPLRPRERG